MISKHCTQEDHAGCETLALDSPPELEPVLYRYERSLDEFREARDRLTPIWFAGQLPSPIPEYMMGMTHALTNVTNAIADLLECYVVPCTCECHMRRGNNGN